MKMMEPVGEKIPNSHISLACFAFCEHSAHLSVLPVPNHTETEGLLSEE